MKPNHSRIHSRRNLVTTLGVAAALFGAFLASVVIVGNNAQMSAHFSGWNFDK